MKYFVLTFAIFGENDIMNAVLPSFTFDFFGELHFVTLAFPVYLRLLYGVVGWCRGDGWVIMKGCVQWNSVYG